MDFLGDINITGKVTVGAVGTEGSSMEGLFRAGSGDITKRVLGTMALQASSNFYTAAASDARFLQTVNISLPSIFNLTQATATAASPNLIATLVNQSANTVFAAPNGSNGTPTFRSLLVGDVSGLQTALDAKLSGAGTTNYLSKYTAAGTLGISQVFDNGTNISVGHASPVGKLDILTGASNDLGGYLIARTDATTAYRGGILLTNNVTSGGYSFKLSSSFNSNTSAAAQLGMVANNAPDTFLNGGAAVEIRYNSDVVINKNLLVATAPTVGSHATNKTYVDGKTWAISAVTGLQTALDTKLSGAGTTNYLAKYTAAGTLGISQVFDNGTNVGINTASPNSSHVLHVNGSMLVSSALFGTPELGIGIYNYFGTNPRIISGSFMGIQTTNLHFYGPGDIQYARLNSTGLKIGQGAPAYKLDVGGSIAYSGMLNVGSPENGVALSEGTDGQFLKKASGMYLGMPFSYNKWDNILISDVTGLQTALDAKLSGAGTTNYLSKYTAAGTLGISQVFDNGTNISVGHASPVGKLDVLTGASNDLGGYLIARTSASTAYRGGILLTNNVTSGGYSFKLSSSFNSNASAAAQLGMVANNAPDTFLNGGAAIEMRYNGDVLMAPGANVGIGAINNAYKLNVEGTGKFTGNVDFGAFASSGNVPTGIYHLTNKLYVDTAIGGINTSLANKWTIGGNALSNTASIGSTNNYNIQLIRNNVVGLIMNADGIYNVKKLAVGRGAGPYDYFESTAAFGGNVIIGGWDSVIQGSYDLNMVAHNFNDNPNNASRKTRIKFGYYYPAEFLNKYKRTIEYWRADDSIVIGSHSSMIPDTATTAPVETNSVYISAGGALSIGVNDTAYKLNVNGTGRFANDVTFEANAIIATAPTVGSHATNKTYVDGKTWAISAVTGLQTALDAKLSGGGTTNYLSKYTAAGTLGISQVFDNGTNISVGHASPVGKLDILTGASNDLGGYLIARTSASTAYRGGILLTNNVTSGGYSFKLSSSFNSNTSAAARMGMVANNAPDTFLNDVAAIEMRYNGDVLMAPGANVGIGAINNAYKLNVEGAVRFAGIAFCAIAPTNASHLTNKAYVDSLSYVKRGDSVRTISLSTITLSGTQTINGVALVAGDLILVAGQTTASQNGVYVVASGAWSRSTENDSDTEIRGAYHYITAGTYLNQRYINTNTSTITVGTTAITYGIDFGGETDPVWTAYKTANDIDNKLVQWNTAYGWGNHASAGYAAASSISGTVNYLARFTGSGAVGNSQLFDNGTNVGIATSSPAYKLDVNGAGRFSGEMYVSGNVGMGTTSPVGKLDVLTGASNDLGGYLIARTSASTAYRGGILLSNNVTSGGYSFKLSSSFNSNASAAAQLGMVANNAPDTFLNGGAAIEMRYNGDVLMAPGANVGIGAINNAYKLNVEGAGRFAGNLNLGFGAKLLLNGNAGLDHQFVKYNGTGNEWAYMNTGELQDKNDLVMLGTYAGERGFRMYSDSSNAYANALVFSNQDAGIALGLHGYAVGSSDTLNEFGMQLDTDGYLYHKRLDGTRARIATVDMLGSGGGGSGILYTGSSPIHVSGNTISIHTASASQAGALSSSDWTTFSNKFGEQSTVSSWLAYATNAEIRFNPNPISNASDASIFVDNNHDLFISTSRFWYGRNVRIIANHAVHLKTTMGSGGAKIEELVLGTNSADYYSTINGSKINFNRASAPANGAKFVLQYNSADGIYYLMPA